MEFIKTTCQASEMKKMNVLAVTLYLDHDHDVCTSPSFDTCPSSQPLYSQFERTGIATTANAVTNPKMASKNKGSSLQCVRKERKDKKINYKTLHFYKTKF